MWNLLGHSPWCSYYPETTSDFAFHICPCCSFLNSSCSLSLIKHCQLVLPHLSLLLPSPCPPPPPPCLVGSPTVPQDLYSVFLNHSWWHIPSELGPFSFILSTDVAVDLVMPVTKCLFYLFCAATFVVCFRWVAELSGDVLVVVEVKRGGGHRPTRPTGVVVLLFCHQWHSQQLAVW